MIKDTDDLRGHPRTSVRLKSIKLAAGDDLPSEMLLFRAGWNRTTKGNFLFDDLSAAAVMSRYSTRGVDISFDLEHLSLDEDSPAFDPDARGWGKLELRDGDLWVVGIKWNEDGARRLRAKTQRYLSPAFTISTTTMRILEIINIAICANPATFDAPQLVAASARLRTKISKRLGAKVKTMDETLKKIAARLGLADGATMEDCVAAIDALKAAVDDTSDAPADDEAEASDDAAPGEDDDTVDTSLTPDDVKDLPAKAQAVILALSGSVATLSRKLKAVSHNVGKSEVEAIIKANTDKIPAYMEKWARGQTPDNLRVYLQHAKPVTAAASKRSAEPARKAQGTEATDDGEVIELTAAELRVCKDLKRDPAKLLAHKKELHKRKQEREAS